MLAIIQPPLFPTRKRIAENGVGWQSESHYGGPGSLRVYWHRTRHAHVSWAFRLNAFYRLRKKGAIDSTDVQESLSFIYSTCIKLHKSGLNANGVIYQSTNTYCRHKSTGTHMRFTDKSLCILIRKHLPGNFLETTR